MRVNAKITKVVTINTDTGARENQPLAEFTLEVRKEGGAPREIKFTEMLSNLAGMDAIQVADYLAVIMEDYARTAIKGQEALGPDKKWVEQSQLIGTEFTFDL